MAAEQTHLFVLKCDLCKLILYLCVCVLGSLIHQLLHKIPKDGTIATHNMPVVSELFSFLNAIR